MNSQLKRGLIDPCVLAILLRSDSYGYKITKEMSSLMRISESTVYPILKRMEEQGLLETYTQEHKGRLRKYYAITSAGKGSLIIFQKQWEDIKKVIDYIMEGQNDQI